MKRTILLFILAAFIAGGLLGYSDLFPLPGEDRNTPETTNDVRTDSRASGLKLVRNDSSCSRTLPSKNTLNSFLLKYTEFSPQETRAELERLLKVQKDDKKYDYALYQSLSYLSFKLAYQSPEEAKRILEDKSNPQRNILYSSLLEGWAEKDFQGAMNYLLSHKNKNSPQTFKTITESLTTRDPDKALKWIPTLTPGERETALNIMAGAIPKQHPEKMKEFLTLLTPKALSSSQITTTLVNSWAESDWDSFKSWTNTLKGYKQDSVLSDAFTMLSQTAPDKAMEEFKKADKGKKDEIAKYIIRGMDYEKKSEGKALDWVLENRDSFSNLPDMISDVMSDAWTNNSSKLKEKALQLPEGQLRDSALSSLVQSQLSNVIGGDYEEDTINKYKNLLMLTEKINDPEMRSNATERCARHWASEYPEEAHKWITEKSPFSDQVKKELLEYCDNSQKRRGIEKS